MTNTHIYITGSEVIVVSIGIIGTGVIGGMLARAFGRLPEEQVIIFNRSVAKAEAIRRECSRIRVAHSLPDLVTASDLVLLCTRPSDAEEVMTEIGPGLRSSQTLATTISQIPLAVWEQQTAARVAKVIPSITQTVPSGVVLICYGSRFDGFQERFETIFGRIATPFVVEEHQLRLSSDLASCGPAFLAHILSQWSVAAARVGDLSQAECEYILSRMLMGVSDLLKNGFTLSEIIRQVAIPGGVTQAGIESLGADVQELFVRLHHATSGGHPSTVAATGIKVRQPDVFSSPYINGTN
ncbi:MAG: NAD(P)-binding domain-containing protein [Alicyclobacillus shizuokensis]|nr:NAD(P)-binding domain-containing protein [Alicyclobacillus shizuokensis]